VLADVLKRLGAAAELRDELRHPHARATRARPSCCARALRSPTCACSSDTPQ
jgi:hypothetical protein